MRNTYLDLFCPLDTEHLWDFIAAILDEKKVSYKKADKKILKKEVLELILILLNANLIYAGNEVLNQSTFKKWDLSNENIIKKIDELWLENAKYPDFFGMVCFGSQEWYVKKTEELGLTMTTNWKTFVKEKIGDLEQWIKENNPENHSP